MIEIGIPSTKHLIIGYAVFHVLYGIVFHHCTLNYYKRNNVNNGRLIVLLLYRMMYGPMDLLVHFLWTLPMSRICALCCYVATRTKVDLSNKNNRIYANEKEVRGEDIPAPIISMVLTALLSLFIFKGTFIPLIVALCIWAVGNLIAYFNSHKVETDGQAD